MSDHEGPNNFRVYIQRAFDKRLRRDPRFTQKAFAAELEISNQRLSRILNGKLGLSLAEAYKMAKLMALPKQETEMFVTLVQAVHGRSSQQRQVAQDLLNNLSQKRAFKELSPDQAKGMTDWYYFPVFMLFAQADAKASATWVAERVGLDLATAEEALVKLFGAGLLLKEADGQWVQATPYLNLYSAHTTQDIRNFYRVMIQKGVESIENVDATNRNLTASFMTVTESTYEYAKKRIHEFCTTLVKELGENVSEDIRIYSLTTQFFPLDQLTPAKGPKIAERPQGT